MTTGDYILLGLTIVVGVLTIIEKSQRIKKKPLSYLFGREETNKKIDKLANNIAKLSDALENSNDIERERYKRQAKMFISNFASDLRCCKKADILKAKSKGQFASILDLCDEYLDMNWNSEVRHDAEYIQETFGKLKDKI